MIWNYLAIVLIDITNLSIILIKFQSHRKHKIQRNNVHANSIRTILIFVKNNFSEKKTENCFETKAQSLSRKKKTENINNVGQIELNINYN